MRVVLVPNGQSYDLEACKNEKYDRLLLLSASGIADVKITDLSSESMLDEARRAESDCNIIDALVGAYSQSVIRGLPLDSVKIETASGVHECVTTCGKVYLKYAKCKEWLSKSKFECLHSILNVDKNASNFLEYNGERYILVPIDHSRVTSGDLSAQSPFALIPETDTVIGELDEKT